MDEAREAQLSDYYQQIGYIRDRVLDVLVIVLQRWENNDMDPDQFFITKPHLRSAEQNLEAVYHLLATELHELDPEFGYLGEQESSDEPNR